MKFTNLTKRLLSAVLIFSIFLTLSACTQADNTTAQSKASSEQTQSESEEYAFTKGEGMNVVSLSGEEYEFLTFGYNLYYIGGLKSEGSVKGEKQLPEEWSYYYKAGLYSINIDQTCDVLIRIFPDNEWFGVYRRSGLPPFDFSADNCVRFEYVAHDGEIDIDTKHKTCGKGITDKAEIAEFLADVRSQKDPDEAGLYDLVRRPDELLLNCYGCGYICGYFEEEPNLVLRMGVTSYNGKAYSVYFEGKEYVLPNEWIEKL